MKSVIVTLIVVAMPVSGIAQDQLFVPECDACPEFSTPPYPHSGWWSNPFESGTGINLDVQNGIAAANLFAYKEDGSPIWYQFSNSLEQAEDPNVYWTLTADLLAFSGGQTLTSEHSHPDHEVVGTISVEFLRRNLLRFQVDDGPVRTMSSYMFGAGSERYFEPESNIRAPSFIEGNPISEQIEAPWTIVQMDPDGNRYGFASIHGRPHWGQSGVDAGESPNASYFIGFWEFDAPFHMQHTGTLICGTGQQLAEDYAALVSSSISDEKHLCLMSVFAGNPDSEDRVYFIRVGDITDRNFIGVSEDGWVVKGFRLLYN